MVLTRRVVEHMERGYSAQQAIDLSLAYMKERVNGCGGLIAISKGGLKYSISHSHRAHHSFSFTGEVGMAFTTPRMPWALAKLDTSGEASLVASGIDPKGHQQVHPSPRILNSFALWGSVATLVIVTVGRFLSHKARP